jgi:phosphate-selective porin OprO and OprP
MKGIAARGRRAKDTQELAFVHVSGRQNQERRAVVNRQGYALAALAVIMFTVGGSVAFGQDSAVSADRMNQLESMVKAQQEQIAGLQQQVATQQAGGVEQMRVEEIKRVVQELFRDPAFRDQLPLNAGYDGGFFIRSGQDFMLKINGVMQARYVFDCLSNHKNLDHNSPLYNTDVGHDRSGLEFNRIHLAFSGYAWDPNFSYRIELQADDTENVGIYYAWMNYKFVEAANIRVGLYKLPFGRQETTSDQKQMLVDRSLANEVFNAGRSMGVMLHGALFDRRLDYGVSVSNGLKNNLDSVDNPDANNALDTNPAITARTVYHAMYDKIGKDFEGESDLEYHKKPALDFGASFAWNADRGDSRNVTLPFQIPDKTRNGPGGYGLSSANNTNIAQFGLDSAFKYLGFATQAEYFLRIVENERTTSPWFLSTNENGSIHQQGGYWQAGYFVVPQKVELVARLGGVWDFGNDNMWEYAGGVNYYIRGHNLKLQADVTRINESPVRSSRLDFANQNDDMTLFRLQLQASF